MNKAEKEAAEKSRIARETMTDREFEEFTRERQIESLAKRLHFELFPEEYDHMMDSIADARDRRKGRNPMNEDYIRRVDARRKEQGVPPLGTDGMPTCNTSWDVAYAVARSRFGSQ